MRVTAERFIQIAQFDKTINAQIIEIDNNDDTLFYVSTTGCSRLPVHKVINDNTIYVPGDNVYVNIPGGDFSSPDKIIIGKISSYNYKASIKAPSDYLVDASKTYQTIENFPNTECYSTIIVEFVPIIQSIEGAIGVKEVIFPYTLTFTDQEGIEKQIKGLWSTRNLYGNIFNSFIPNKQYIIIKGLSNYRNITFKWELEDMDYYSMTPLTFGGKEIPQKCIANIINNQKFYFNYDIEDFDEQGLFNTYIILTETGCKFFRSIDGVWVEQSSDYSVEQMNKEDAEKGYTWRLEWYQRNLGLLEDEMVNYLPSYWEPLKEEPKDYHKKLVCLVAVKANIEKEDNTNRKVLYSILE